MYCIIEISYNLYTLSAVHLFINIAELLCFKLSYFHANSYDMLRLLTANKNKNI